MPNPDIDGTLTPLPEALRALPQVAPEHSTWPQLAAQLTARGNVQTARMPPVASRRRRWAVPAALAAGVVLAAIAVPLLQRHDPATASIVATDPAQRASIVTNAANSANGTSTQLAADPGDAPTQLAVLQQHSQALEHWLHETGRAAAPLSGQDLAAAAEIEDMIGLVDGQLNSAPRESELLLWRRRVALLEDLAALRYSSYQLAETGVALR